MGNKELTILGAGPAGLAAGFYAQKAGINFRILEAGNRIGGNAATLREGDFLYDTGAHRWHDQLPEITAEVKDLLGDELMEIQVPSQILSRGRFFDFPLSPLNLVCNLGFFSLLKAGLEVAANQWKKQPEKEDFKTLALSSYGPTIANRFLLGYSEKLWGAPAQKLSYAISGKRLKGLNLKTFLVEIFRGSKAKTCHLDGGFYYPKQGIGVIADKMAHQIGRQHIRFQAKVKEIHHQNDLITAIVLDNGEATNVQELVSTLPLTTIINALYPAAPAHILAAAGALTFRHLLLVVLFIDKVSVTANASVYFPDPDLLFTRLYEPRNRSRFMAPDGKTSVVIEIPSSAESELWKKSDEELITQTLDKLVALKFFSVTEVISGKVHRVPFAYPILLQEGEQHISGILGYLSRFRNLHLAGRAASFKYTHLHDHFLQAKSIISRLKI